MKTTLNYKGVDFEIDFDYQPAERAERGPEAQYPGCGEAVEAINEIKFNGTCFLEVLENDIEEIQEAILDQMHEIIESYLEP